MKAGGRIEQAGKLVTWLLVVLLVLGLAGGAAYLVMKSRGMTFYAETEGEKIFGGAEKTLFSGAAGRMNFPSARWKAEK